MAGDLDGDLGVDVLGPVAVRWRGGPVAVDDPAAQAVVAALAYRGWLSYEELAGHLRDHLPAAARADVPGYLKRPLFLLRQALAHGGVDQDPLARRDGGYELRLDREAVDAHRFVRLTGEAWRWLRAGDVAGARRLFDQTLALWRGEPFTGLAHFDDARAALAEPHRRARRGLLAARIDLGEARAVLTEVAVLAEEEPDERDTAYLHALALYRCGSAGRAGQVLDVAVHRRPDEGLAGLRALIDGNGPPPTALAGLAGG